MVRKERNASELETIASLFCKEGRGRMRQDERGPGIACVRGGSALAVCPGSETWGCLLFHRHSRVSDRRFQHFRIAEPAIPLEGRGTRVVSAIFARGQREEIHQWPWHRVARSALP